MTEPTQAADRRGEALRAKFALGFARCVHKRTCQHHRPASAERLTKCGAGEQRRHRVTKPADVNRRQPRVACTRAEDCSTILTISAAGRNRRNAIRAPQGINHETRLAPISPTEPGCGLFKVRTRADVAELCRNRHRRNAMQIAPAECGRRQRITVPYVAATDIEGKRMTYTGRATGPAARDSVRDARQTSWMT